MYFLLLSVLCHRGLTSTKTRRYSYDIKQLPTGQKRIRYSHPLWCDQLRKQQSNTRWFTDSIARRCDEQCPVCILFQFLWYYYITTGVCQQYRQSREGYIRSRSGTGFLCTCTAGSSFDSTESACANRNSRFSTCNRASQSGQCRDYRQPHCRNWKNPHLPRAHLLVCERLVSPVADWWATPPNARALYCRHWKTQQQAGFRGHRSLPAQQFQAACWTTRQPFAALHPERYLWYGIEHHITTYSCLLFHALSECIAAYSVPWYAALWQFHRFYHRQWLRSANAYLANARLYFCLWYRWQGILPAARCQQQRQKRAAWVAALYVQSRSCEHTWSLPSWWSFFRCSPDWKEAQYLRWSS